MTTQKEHQQAVSHYDPHIIPAETAAREAREGEHWLAGRHNS